MNPAPHVSEPSFDEIADDVYAFVQPHGGWCLNNAGLIARGDGAVLVDTAATEARARRLRQEVEGVAPGGVDIVVNTHFHGDHTFGNGQFTPRATVVAHEETRRDAAEARLMMRDLWPRVEWGDTPLTLPNLTFRDALTVYAGDLAVELLHVGPAHTASDVVAWVPDRRVLLTGDVVWSGVTPFVLMGSLEGSLRALSILRTLNPETVVPGHGPVGGPELLDATESYLRWLIRLAQDGERDGLSPLQCAHQADLGAFAPLVDTERLVANLHRAYAEQRGQRHGERIDVIGPMREMAEFNGGLPDCHA